MEAPLKHPQSAGETPCSPLWQVKKWGLREWHTTLTSTQLGSGKAGVATQCVCSKLLWINNVFNTTFEQFKAATSPPSSHPLSQALRCLPQRTGAVLFWGVLPELFYTCWDLHTLPPRTHIWGAAWPEPCSASCSSHLVVYCMDLRACPTSVHLTLPRSFPGCPPPHWRRCHNWFSSSSVDGRLSCFHLLAVMNSEYYYDHSCASFSLNICFQFFGEYT